MTNEAPDMSLVYFKRVGPGLYRGFRKADDMELSHIEKKRDGKDKDCGMWRITYFDRWGYADGGGSLLSYRDGRAQTAAYCASLDE